MAFPTLSHYKPTNSPVTVSYGVPFANSNSDLYPTLDIAVLLKISCCVGPRYNGTWQNY